MQHCGVLSVLCLHLGQDQCVVPVSVESVSAIQASRAMTVPVLPVRIHVWLPTGYVECDEK